MERKKKVSLNGKEKRYRTKEGNEKWKLTKREVELGALNTRRHLRQLWAERMAEIPMPSMREEVKTSQRIFDRLVDTKNYSISFLMDAIVEAEDQYYRNERSHMETIDSMLNLHKEIMKYQRMSFRERLHQMVCKVLTENNKVSHKLAENEILLRSIDHNVNQRLEHLLNDTRSLTISKVSAFVEENDNQRRITIIELEKQLEIVWQNLWDVLIGYRNDTKDREKAYNLLHEKDLKERRTINRQLIDTMALYESIKILRGKVSCYKSKIMKEVHEVVTLHDVFCAAYRSTIQRVSLEQEKRKEQLTIMILECKRVTQRLRKLVIKGNRLIVFIQMCRKYEAQREKVLPLDSTLSTTFPDSGKTTTDFEDLYNFWRRLGATQMMTTELRMEANNLKLQISYLRDSLKNRLSQVFTSRSRNSFA